MICYVSFRLHQDTLRRFLETLGRRVARRVRLVSYERLLASARVPVATYVFADIERLSPAETERAAAVWSALRADGRSRLVNDPVRAMRRYELLRTLFEAGQNPFDVYHLTEARRPTRYPVFIRGENDHGGPLSGLLEDAAALARSIDRLVAEGRPREDKLITEFVDVRDAEGYVHKYGAFRIGSRIVPRHLLFSREWAIKGWGIETGREDLLRAELAYVEENPHAALLMPFFETARIDYGRIDYAMVDGRPVVFEINTNPATIVEVHGGAPTRAQTIARFAEGFDDALGALDSDASGSVAIPPAPRPERLPRLTATRFALYDSMQRLGLQRFNGPFVVGLRQLRKRLLGRHTG